MRWKVTSYNWKQGQVNHRNFIYINMPKYPTLQNLGQGRNWGQSTKKQRYENQSCAKKKHLWNNVGQHVSQELGKWFSR